MRKFWVVLVPAIIFSVLAGIFWGIAIAGLYDGLRMHDMSPDVGAAVTSSCIAAQCWLTAWRERRRELSEMRQAEADNDKAILLRTLADVLPARPWAPTIPFRRAL